MRNLSLTTSMVQIHGMHCTSCEILIERTWKKMPGIEKVQVNHAKGYAQITHAQPLNLQALNEAIKPHGYTVTPSQAFPSPLAGEGRVRGMPHTITLSRDHAETGAVFLVLAGLYMLVKYFDFIPQGLSIGENMSYGFIFLIGLVAAMSTCLAVTGGLLLAVGTTWSTHNPNATNAQKFKPHIYFNLGRIASYTILGGLIGALGSVISLSPRMNGLLTIAVSVVMILLGMQLLKLFPGLRRLHPKLPKFLAHKIHDLAESKSPIAPFMLGAGTFFLPCGFTQALQLYALSQGSFTTGALIMLVFSLGTLPALLSLGVVTSFAHGNFQRYMLKFAGAVVLVLGFSSIGNGLVLAGMRTNPPAMNYEPTTTNTMPPTNVELKNGIQIARMQVRGLRYIPANFTVVQGIPVEWHIDASGTAGCAQVLLAPKLGVREYLSRQKEKIITFTPREPDIIPFSCGMGMTTRGAAFTVVANTNI